MSGFARGQAVQLELVGHGRWSARVKAVMDGRLALAALAALPVALRDLAGMLIHVAAATPRGILHAPGVVLAADRTGLVEVALTGDAELDQRRNHVRVPVAVPGLVAPLSREHPPLHTYTIDVSGGGVLVAGAGPADIGAAVSITVKLPDRDPLQAEGRIARRTGGGHVGVVFEGISEHDRELLVRWIFERQRLERQAARERR